MGKREVIDLDAMRADIIVKFDDKEYKCLELDGDMLLDWREALRKRNRMEKAYEQLRVRFESDEGMPEKQLDELEKKLAKLEKDMFDLDARTLTRVLPGMDTDTVRKMPFRLRTYVMQYVTDMMKEGSEEIIAEAEAASGELQSQLTT